jgi:hypothetical protein
MQEADVGAPMHLALHRHLRQEGDAIAMGHHLHDGGEARGPETLARLRRHQAAKGQRLVAQAMTFLQEKQPLVRQHVGGLGPLSLDGAGREHELVVEQMERSTRDP